MLEMVVTMLDPKPFPSEPSVQMMSIVGPKVCKYDGSSYENAPGQIEWKSLKSKV